MSNDTALMQSFVEYAERLAGYEKGEAQVFCDRLFQAFGHDGYKEAGATLEFKVKMTRGRGNKFADLLWQPHVLIEMKSRGEDLQKHYRQAFDYWLHIVPNRPRYVVLCNFDEFWIYDFDTQLDSPVDRLAIEELPQRHPALTFLRGTTQRPLFGNDKVRVTREAAAKVAAVFQALLSRGENRDEAQRLILQAVVAMFAEDFDLLPRGLFTRVVADCADGESAYDLLGGLLRQMGDPTPARAGRFSKVPYFNGGLFQVVQPLELEREECQLLLEAASEEWSSVAPPIFGTLFQQSMDESRRHHSGAHFTEEVDIQKVVRPTIVRPWQERIDAARSLKELRQILAQLATFRVLDPTCGSGNFLYIAYRELVHLEMEVLTKIHENFGHRARKEVLGQSLISTTQFYGIDKDPFAVELAKVTLMLAKRLAVAETLQVTLVKQQEIPLELEQPLPLDNLDDNIRADDALFCRWPAVDVIIGNPPYQSKNKMQAEFGRAYLNRLHDRYPEVPGRADYCVYFFRRAHEELPAGGRAGLVGTNTIRQNYSREGGLDYIVQTGGTITEAVSTQVWSGDAAVHVSIVNWIRGRAPGPKLLFRQLGDSRDSPWEKLELDHIAAALSGRVDVTGAQPIKANRRPKRTFQGLTHGHEGLLLQSEEAEEMLRTEPGSGEVLFPYLIAEDLLGRVPPTSSRWLIDFQPRDLFEARRYELPFAQVERAVLPTRKARAREEKERNAAALADNPKARVNHHHANFLRRWWLPSYGRAALVKVLGGLKRYIVCGRVSKRPVFVFVSAAVRPGDALQVFTLEDDYSFGVLQSTVHWEWFVERCSTLKGDFRYTSATVFDSFPWPQTPSTNAIAQVVESARSLRRIRREILESTGLCLREIYRTLELPGQNDLRSSHELLDEAVRAAYGLSRGKTVLEQLLALNQDLRSRERTGARVNGPGLPPELDPADFSSDDTLACS